MRMRLLAAGIAAAALFPSLAFAQNTCEQQHNDRVVGTVAGAGLGAVIGSAVAGHGNRTTGAVIGAVGGGIVGNQLTRGSADCAHAYGYYDNQNNWHANAVDRSVASGYYNRDGQWVDGAPNGYYDSNGRWTTADSSAAQSGYYDAKGRFVPASANGYYDSDGQWVGGTASGYYDGSGRWVAGPANGRYDSNGRWINGAASGHRDANGAWVADPQPGYYDSNGRWHAGQASGYYDGGGRWVATSGYASPPAMINDNNHWAGGDRPRDIRSRAAWLEQRIRSNQNDGSMSRYEARAAMRTLATIRQREARMRHYNGRLNQRDEASIQAQLDDLSTRVRT